MSIYLDHNASTPVDERVLDSMISIYREYYGNADSRTHDYGNNARKKVEEAREQIALLLDVTKDEIIFTSGATESNNLAILGIDDYGIKNNKRHIITTAIEHKAVLEPCKILSKKGFEVDYIYPDASGRINAGELLSKVRPDTLLVSVMHVNNETGIIQPVQEIGDELSKTNTYFHIDAAQSCGKLVDEIKSLRYDLLSITAHKMYGPQGIGALVLRMKKYKRPPISPIAYGGGHERGLRPGTSPVALIVGFGKACEIAEKEHKKAIKQYNNTKEQLLGDLYNSDANFIINGNPEFCMPNTLNISFPGVDSEALMLAIRQCCSVSNGSACTSHDYNHSHVLSAMGLSNERIESAIRISWGREKFSSHIVHNIIDFVKQIS